MTDQQRKTALIVVIKMFREVGKLQSAALKAFNRAVNKLQEVIDEV
jgi:hypothetical protein